jgi:hypothetical protein
MRIKTAVIAAAFLISVGCYNNPHRSERAPGEGPQHIHADTAVGPGRTPGGSTAGPQRAKSEAGGHTAPQPGGATPSDQGLGHAGAPAPVPQHDASTPKGTPSTSGNEKGVGDRGPQPQHGPAKH